MAQVGSPNSFGKRILWTGIAGVNDDDIVLETTDVSHLNTFTLMSTAGAMDVDISLDGVNFTTASLSMADLGSTSTAPVIVTAAGRLYGFRGNYKLVRVLQKGATAVANAVLLASREN